MGAVRGGVGYAAGATTLLGVLRPQVAAGLLTMFQSQWDSLHSCVGTSGAGHPCPGWFTAPELEMLIREHPTA
jgi:hypothetical protein